jgi:hypothetical protein
MDKLKCPSMNFYPESFITGTRRMTDEEVGIYIRALCYQFSEGSIESDEWREFPERVKKKFIKTPEGYKNERLEFEKDRKNRYAESRRKNRIK